LKCSGRALAEGNQWYYYSRRTQNRVTGNGYWKPTGMEEPVVSSSNNKRVGMKKYFVFHVGEAAAGIKTNWIMQEYRLSDSASSTRSSKRKPQPKAVSTHSYTLICVRINRHKHTKINKPDYTIVEVKKKMLLSLSNDDEFSHMTVLHICGATVWFDWWFLINSGLQEMGDMSCLWA